MHQHGVRVLRSPHLSQRRAGGRPERASSTRLRLIACAAVALAIIPACDALDPQPEAAPTGCAATVADAAQAVEVDQQVDLLDTALIACRSYGAFTSELARYPGIIGYDPATFVSLRCARVTDQLIRRSPTCATVIAPATTPPPPTVPDVVFVGETLDGRQIEIRPSATVRFDGDVPAVVQQTVDIFHESGCEGVIEQRDLWASRVADPAFGDIASVYAKHAQNVADYVQCDSPPIPTE